MTTNNSLPHLIDDLLARHDAPDQTLHELVQLVGTTLNADRCFLYVRQPDQQRGRIAFCWRKDEGVPDMIQPDWQPDTTDLPAEDPLIRAGLAMKPSVYVDDVETAPADVLNQEFERKTFGHRALIHAHIQWDGQLWGILQPCVFGRPRHWTDVEKEQVEAILPRLQPIIAAYTMPV